jgi:hypothetical protein
MNPSIMDIRIVSVASVVFMISVIITGVQSATASITGADGMSDGKAKGH